jgi:hypothetical protein
MAEIGAVVGIVTCLIAWAMLTFIPRPRRWATLSKNAK